MERAALLQLAADNRRHAARLFRDLAADQWSAQSLCAEWTVRDVAGHFIVPLTLSMPRVTLGILRHRGSFDDWTASASKQLAQRPTAEIISVLEERSDSTFTPPGFGPDTPVCDTAIHLRDFARPLGLQDASPPLSTWRITLDFLVTAKALKAFSHKGLLEGIELRATDQDWRYGAGSPLEGTSEALALAISGRAAVLGELSGGGVATLARRLNR